MKMFIIPAAIALLMPIEGLAQERGASANQLQNSDIFNVKYVSQNSPCGSIDNLDVWPDAFAFAHGQFVINRAGLCKITTRLRGGGVTQIMELNCTNGSESFSDRIAILKNKIINISFSDGSTKAMKACSFVPPSVVELTTVFDGLMVKAQSAVMESHKILKDGEYRIIDQKCSDEVTDSGRYIFSYNKYIESYEELCRIDSRTYRESYVTLNMTCIGEGEARKQNLDVKELESGKIVGKNQKSHEFRLCSSKIGSLEELDRRFYEEYARSRDIRGEHSALPAIDHNNKPPSAQANVKTRIESRYSKAYVSCMASGEAAVGVTSGILECVQSEIRRQDIRLNQTYGCVMAVLESKQKLMLRSLQRRWITHRDPQCQKAAYAERGGSLAAIIHADCTLDETIKRTIWLEEYGG